jgi:paired small multidrug resistance pump
MDLFHRLLDKFDLMIAGFFGALVATRFHKEDLTDRKTWLIFLVTGMACANYLTGMVSTYFGIVEPRSVAGVGFLLGAFGGSLMAAITRAINAADLWSFIKSRFGGPSP